MEGQTIMAILVGLFIIIPAAGDFNWFMNHYKARLFIKLFGRNGARVFYIILGIFVMVTGFIM